MIGGTLSKHVGHDKYLKMLFGLPQRMYPFDELDVDGNLIGNNV